MRKHGYLAGGGQTPTPNKKRRRSLPRPCVIHTSPPKAELFEAGVRRRTAKGERLSKHSKGEQACRGPGAVLRPARDLGEFLLVVRTTTPRSNVCRTWMTESKVIVESGWFRALCAEEDEPLVAIFNKLLSRVPCEAPATVGDYEEDLGFWSALH
jgi:hypothetical protein